MDSGQSDRVEQQQKSTSSLIITWWALSIIRLSLSLAKEILGRGVYYGSTTRPGPAGSPGLALRSAMLRIISFIERLLLYTQPRPGRRYNVM